jgi:hypothetical protein
MCLTSETNRGSSRAKYGKTVEWKNATIPAYQRRTKHAAALIAGAYLAGTNTRGGRLNKRTGAISFAARVQVRRQRVARMIIVGGDRPFPRTIQLTPRKSPAN